MRRVIPYAVVTSPGTEAAIFVVPDLSVYERDDNHLALSLLKGLGWLKKGGERTATSLGNSKHIVLIDSRYIGAPETGMQCRTGRISGCHQLPGQFPQVIWDPSPADVAPAFAFWMAYRKILTPNSGKWPVTISADNRARITARLESDSSGIGSKKAKVTVEFSCPGGTVTGRLLPAGSPTMVFQLHGEPVVASVVDILGVVVLVRPSELGLCAQRHSGDLITDDRAWAGIAKIKSDADARLDHVLGYRAQAKIGLVSTRGEENSKAFDLMVWDGTACWGQSHLLPGCSTSMAVALAGAAKIPGTVLNQLLGKEQLEQPFLRLRCGWDWVSVGATLEPVEGGLYLVAAQVQQEVQLVAEGEVELPG